VSAAWVDEMRNVAGQGPIEASEAIDSHWVFDLAAGFDVTPAISVNARVENLLDETYMASRRPAGARPGRPRAFFMGLTGRF
jgi:Fe(3+) dicitrate transport protein